jgi:cytoskeleton protein RodZ
MTPDGTGRIEIGAALRDARRRYGMDVREVEDRTKIRAKYIRALENEDWETLPAPAYIRGFLRTYGSMVGLDGEMLVDEFRRRYGSEAEAIGPAPPDPILTGRRRPGERPPSRGPLILAVLAGIVVLLLLLSLLGGSDDPAPQEPRGQGQAKQARAAQRKADRQAQQQRKARKKAEANRLQKVDAMLKPLSTVAVCLVAGSDTALIDNQVLLEGAKEQFGPEKRYRLTLGPGAVKFVVGDTDKKLEVAENASFEGDSKGIREITYRGPECP